MFECLIVYAAVAALMFASLLRLGDGADAFHVAACLIFAAAWPLVVALSLYLAWKRRGP